MSNSDHKCYFKDCDSSTDNRKVDYIPFRLSKDQIITVCDAVVVGAHHAELRKCYCCQVGKNEGKTYLITFEEGPAYSVCEKHIEGYRCDNCGVLDVPHMYGNGYNFSKCSQCKSEICSKCLKEYDVDKWKNSNWGRHPLMFSKGHTGCMCCESNK